MERVRFGIAFAVLLTASLFSGCSEQTTGSARIDPRADEALRRMGATLRGAGSFSLQSATTMDEPVATGQLAMFSRESRIVVRRPDRVFAEIRERADTWLFWYAGSNLTVLDKTGNTCAAAQVPSRIDDMLDQLANKYGLTMPLADLLFADPYKVLVANVLTGKYVGLHEVGGVMCSHLLFTQENVDWQIWIDAGKKPLPRKVVIDYKSLPGRPQFTALLSNWNLSAPAGDEQFKPALPTDAKKVEMAKMFQAERGEK